jgi:hypothetical protein
MRLLRNSVTPELRWRLRVTCELYKHQVLCDRLLTPLSINYAHEQGYSDSAAAQLLAGAQGAFALGRFVGVGIMKYVKPRWVFLVYMSLSVHPMRADFRSHLYS